MKPKIIDLFSGCGGLALGFEKAGFEIASGIELMLEACETISYNLSWRYGKKENHICGDITQLNPMIFKNSIGSEGCIVIGGPPCQAYSKAGIGKLRSLGDDRININDDRGYLFIDFLRFVYELNPKAVVMENVPEATDFGGVNVPELVCAQLKNHGYKAYWTILNSADFGVPQIRLRLFVLAVKESEHKEIKLPQPTHFDISNVGYKRNIDQYSKYPNFRVPISCKNGKPWVTLGDAFSDLPILFPNENSKIKNNKLNMELNYSKEAQNAFQYCMRNWFGYDNFAVTGNVFRKTNRDFPIFARMRQGDDYLAASEIADYILRKEVLKRNIDENSEEYNKLKKKIVPPYDRDKFCGKWRRLEENKPSPTVVAHLCKDTYNFIHPWEPRGISVREAARLQSFPDDFMFDCSMGDAFKQIGNAVPPLLAYGVAKTLAKTFEE